MNTESPTTNAMGMIAPPDKATVQDAIAAVIAELPAIGKTDVASELGYKFRGIENLTAAVQPLLAKHGLVIVPQVQSLQIIDSKASKHPAMQDVILHVNWQIVGPDGSWLTASTWGIGRDHTDKGANKAQTQAYKYLLLHLLCVADPKDDTDGRDAEQEAPAPVTAPVGPDPVKLAFNQVSAFKGTPIAEGLKAWAAEQGGKLTEAALADADWRARVSDKLAALVAAASQDAAAEGPTAQIEGGEAPVAPADEPDDPMARIGTVEAIRAARAEAEAEGGLADRVHQNMSEQGIPSGTDNPELLAQGAKPLGPVDSCDKETPDGPCILRPRHRGKCAASF